jgi:hypothetical protein
MLQRKKKSNNMPHLKQRMAENTKLSSFGVHCLANLPDILLLSVS